MTEEKSPPDSEPDAPNHWQLLWDVLGFQLKLAMDGLRDVMLSPISIGMALYGLVAHPHDPGMYFNRLLKFGRRTDVWINLFGASEHYQDENVPTSDAYIKKLEDLLVSEYQKGGLVRNLRDRTDGLFARLNQQKTQQKDQDDS